MMKQYWYVIYYPTKEEGDYGIIQASSEALAKVTMRRLEEDGSIPVDVFQSPVSDADLVMEDWLFYRTS